MKHFRKVCAVLLAMVMVAVILPTTGLLSNENTSVVPSVDAAEVGEIVNGDFSQSEQKEKDTKDDGCGGTEVVYYNHATGWEQNKWAVNITSGYANFSKDSSVANSVGLSQLVPVNTNATYKLTFKVRGGNPCFTYKITGGSQDGTVLKSGTPSTSSNSYSTNNVEFNTSTYDYVCIQFVCTGTGSSDSRLDDVSLSVVSAGDTGTHAKPTLKSFGTDKNRPASSSDNIIVQPGFESTTNAQWNDANFLTNGVSVATSGGSDGDAHSGSKFLKYYRGSTAPSVWSMFEFTCPTAGEYVFSAWVRTPHLSANNTGKASIGIIDPETGKFLCYGNAGGSYDGHYSNQETQIRSTATDDNWHLRSVTFYVGENNSIVKIGMYGLKSTMYVDDISVHLLSKGVKYEGNQTGTLSVSTSVTNKYCEPEDSLIPDSSFNGTDSKTFWTTSASGWNLGMMEIAKDPQHAVRGNTLHYKGTNTGSNKLYNYIKWIYVEPNTSYTVSFDYRVASAGNTLMFIDNNIVSPAVFHTASLGSVSNSWKTYAITFNSGNYKRIGIVLRNHASAECYLDDFRFFKTADGVADEPAEEVFPTLEPYTHPNGHISRMEMTATELGLAFRFQLAAHGWTLDEESHIVDYTNGKVYAFEDGTEYKLIRAGALVTNNESVGQNPDLFKMANLDAVSKTVIDIQAEKAWEPSDDTLTFAVRVIKIPLKHSSTVIYARPYYIFEYEGREVIAYGDIVFDCYEKLPDINDGWLEWD